MDKTATTRTDGADNRSVGTREAAKQVTHTITSDKTRTKTKTATMKGTTTMTTTSTMEASPHP